MPTKKEVFEAADRVLVSKKRVAQSSVIEDLQANGAGGSPRVVGPHLAAWKVQNRYQARLDVKDLPPRLKGVLVQFARSVWDEGLLEAKARQAEDRKKLRIEREVIEGLMEETYASSEAVTRINEDLRVRQSELEARVLELDAQVKELRKEVVRLERAEFWDRVIREIADVMPEGKWLDATEIMKLLPPSLAKEAIVKDRALTPGRIRRKMLIRVGFERYFEFKAGNGADAETYRRLKGWTGALGPPRKAGGKGAA